LFVMIVGRGVVIEVGTFWECSVIVVIVSTLWRM